MVEIGSLPKSVVKRFTPGDLKRLETEGLVHLVLPCERCTAGSTRRKTEFSKNTHGTSHRANR